MRLLIISDTHGNKSRLKKLLEKEAADIYIHLGDGASECHKLMNEYPDKKIIPVCGNCDLMFTFPADRLITLEGKRIFITHGDRYGVKYSLEHIAREAKAQNASLVLYGHTHKCSTDEIDGITIFNPGSLGRPRDNKPTYGVLEIDSGKFNFQIKSWEE